MSVDWTNAEFADGPMLAAWMRAHGLPAERDALSLYRRLREWESGSRASFACVDRWLTFLGYHPSEAPDDVWLATGPRLGRVPPDERALAIAAYQRLGSIRAAAREAGVGRDSLRRWLSDLADHADRPCGEQAGEALMARAS